MGITTYGRRGGVRDSGSGLHESNSFEPTSRNVPISTQDGANHFAAADRNRPAQRVVNFALRVETEAMENGRGQVLRLHPSLFGIAADGVGRAVHGSSAHPTSRQRHGVHLSPVVPSTGRVETGSAS